LLGLPQAQAAETVLLNASYDVTRELFKDINPVFVADWKKHRRNDQRQPVARRLVQAGALGGGRHGSVGGDHEPGQRYRHLVERGVVAADWAKKFPNNAAPFYSTMVYLVRKGNPKQIKDWDDLAKPGVQVIIPNPKTSGNGRYTYLAAWGSVLKKGGNEAQARELVGKIFKNVPCWTRRPRRHHHLHPARNRRRAGDV
jgi:sulfate transport system substrate-binding protein